MADLDDFFAKKDKKKRSTKKFPTPEDVSKQLEETAAKTKEVKAKKEAPPVNTEGTTETEVVEVSDLSLFLSPLSDTRQRLTDTVCSRSQGDEWKEFVEEGVKDYTGLKIGNLQLKDNDYSVHEGEGDKNAEGGGGDGDRKGPWENQGEGDAAATSSKEQKRKEEPRSVAPSVYVIPQAKSMALNVRKGQLPDLNNQEYFPTLGAAKAEEFRRKKNEPAFEEVKHGGRFQRSSDLDKNAPVVVGNRYNSLADS